MLLLLLALLGVMAAASGRGSAKRSKQQQEEQLNSIQQNKRKRVQLVCSLLERPFLQSLIEWKEAEREEINKRRTNE